MDGIGEERDTFRRDGIIVHIMSGRASTALAQTAQILPRGTVDGLVPVLAKIPTSMKAHLQCRRFRSIAALAFYPISPA